jgi:hypothetical protein
MKLIAVSGKLMKLAQRNGRREGELQSGVPLTPSADPPTMQTEDIFRI